jgi:transketolase
MAAGIRRRVLEHTLRNNGGYLSQACSAAEIFAVLYQKILRLGPLDAPLHPRPFPGTPSAGNEQYVIGNEFHGPITPEFDRFILSPTHYSLVLYTALIEARRLAEDGLLSFNRDGSSVEMIGAEHSPGMEVMTGSLGQGLSQAVGMALGRKLKGAPGRVVVLMSDGEFQIGMTWEAMQFMAYHQLDNMLIYIDANKQQCDGLVQSVMSIEPLAARIRAFGGQVRVVDGHDIAALAKAGAGKPHGKPRVVIANTDPCRGVELLRQNAPKLHYLRFKSAEERGAYQTILTGWNREDA